MESPASPPSSPFDSLTLTPIGVVRSPFVDRAEAPRQPRAAAEIEATIALFAGHGYERALFDLEGWDYLWVLFWFHKNAGWRPQVLPPRSDRRRGVFSTRAPHRPNPLGLSVVRIVSVRGLTVRVAGCDMLDQTPVLDLKPYVPWSDAIPHARTGWLAPPGSVTDRGGEPEAGGATVNTHEIKSAPDSRASSPEGRPADPKASTAVLFSPLARAQLAWLAARGCPVELESAIARVLSLGAHAHPYRRIRRLEDGACELAVKDWRVRFTLEDGACVVASVTTGYRPEALASEPGLDLHREFVRQWT